jgi:hypothetical protein
MSSCRIRRTMVFPHMYWGLMRLVSLFCVCFVPFLVSWYVPWPHLWNLQWRMEQLLLAFTMRCVSLLVSFLLGFSIFSLGIERLMEHSLRFHSYLSAGWFYVRHPHLLVWRTILSIDQNTTRSERNFFNLCMQWSASSCVFGLCILTFYFLASFSLALK